MRSKGQAQRPRRSWTVTKIAYYWHYIAMSADEHRRNPNSAAFAKMVRAEDYEALERQWADAVSREEMMASHLETVTAILKQDNEQHVARCYAAEAERDRLSVALQKIIDYSNDPNNLPPSYECEIAREALSASEPPDDF
jgi:hypothetical protein